VYYFGTNLGASIAAGEDNGIELLRSIVTAVVSPQVHGDKVRPRLIDGSPRSLLAVFNDTVGDQTGIVKLPSKYVRAKDIYDGREYAIEGGTIRMTVPFQSVSVLLLES
jgi:hypothetical protein